MRNRIALVLVGLLLSVCLAKSPQAIAFERKSSGNPRYDAAVDRGVAFLKSKVKEGETDPGQLVLAAYALFKAGEPVESPIIQSGLGIVTKSVGTDGFHPHSSYDHLYEAGLYSMFLADVNAEAYVSQIQTMASYVASVQRADGSWSESATGPADVSMCQYAVLCLWAAQRVGCTVSPQALDRTATWHLSHRQPDGGWTYRPGTTVGATGGRSSRNMTMAAVSTLGVTRLLFYGPQEKEKDEAEKEKEKEKQFGVLEKVEEPEEAGMVSFPDYKAQNSLGTLTAGIEKALDYEKANFNPVNIHQDFPIYFYYSAERALSVSEIKTVAGNEWFSAYGDGLLTLQNQQGAWNETFKSDIVGTSFAVLYFMRSTKQIFDKQYGLGRQQAKRGNPFGDKEVKREPTELDMLIDDISKMDFASLDETPPEVSDEIVRSVISIDDPEKLVGQADKLKSLMKHPNADVRKAACWALGRTGDFGLIPFMLDGIRDPSIDVNVEAIAALRYIARKPNGFGETLDPLKGLPENAPPEERVRVANEWRQKAINTWSKWYFGVRPHEEQDGFDQLEVAVPLDPKKEAK